MTAPYTPALIARLLRGMSDADLRAANPATFQMHPVAKKIVKSAIVNDLIANETARRRAVWST